MESENPQLLADILDSLTPADWDQLIREVAADWDAKRVKRDNPFVLDLIRVLRPKDNGLKRSIVLHDVERTRKRLGLPMRRTFEQTVQQACERFCINSEVWVANGSRDDEGLFTWPKGAGAGYWAIRQPQADNWLREFLKKRQKARAAGKP